MSIHCRTASSTSMASDEQSFLTGRQTHREDVGYLLSGLSMPVASDESSIYNAVRASSDTDRYSLTRGTDNLMDEILAGGMAANLAMFIPLASSPNDSHTHFTSPGQKSKSHWWRSHPLSDNCLPSSSNIDKTLDNFCVAQAEEEEKSHDETQHRKAASLNNASGSLRISKWPGRRLSPVRPAIPKFPPPVRSPTPPGLPTFGTQEAICYSTRFFVRSFARGGQSQRGHPVGADVCAVNRIGTSYRETLRRFIGFPSLTPAPPLRQPVPVIRAEDGTAVLGRFPYRQSGHGVNPTRRLDDHPSHRRALPAVHVDQEHDRADSNLISSDTRLAKPRRRVQAEPVNSCAPTTAEIRVCGSSNVLQLASSPVITPHPSNTKIPMLFEAQGLSTDQTHAAQAQTSRNLMNGNGSYAQGLSRIHGPCRAYHDPCGVGDTVHSQNLRETVMESTGSWLQDLTNNVYMCCCLGNNHEQDDAIYSHSSNETYTTARSWINNAGAIDTACAYTRRVCQTQRLGQWCSSAWISFQGIAFRNNVTTKPWPT